MPIPLLGWVALGAGAYLLGGGLQSAGEAVEDTTNSAIKLIVVGGVAYTVLKTMRR